MQRFWAATAPICCTLAIAAAAAAEKPTDPSRAKGFETVVIEAAPAAAAKAKSTPPAAPVKSELQKQKSPVAPPTGKAPSNTPPGAASPAPAPAAPGAPPAAASKPDVAPKTPPLTEWPAKEVELAEARCVQLLKGLDAVTVPEKPFRDGACGAPAPVRLMSLGKNPAVTFDPPALVTCDMVVAMHKWMTKDVQPLARKHLGAGIAKIETMSDYSCRNAYGRIANKLSEHGRANALDIRGFVTAKGEPAYVLEGWGQTRRDIQRQIAAARAAAEKADAIKAEAERAEAEKAVSAAKAPAAPGTASRAPTDAARPPVATRPTIVDGAARTPGHLPGNVDTKDALTIAPTHLGGPKEKRPAAKPEAQTKSAPTPPRPSASLPEPGAPVPIPPKNKMALFLHGAHEAACQIFGTTLGPEANDAHRNHFHVDMAERKVSKICD